MTIKCKYYNEMNKLDTNYNSGHIHVCMTYKTYLAENNKNMIF